MTLRAVSASQIKTFRLCPRKWAFYKIDQIKRPGSPQTVLGSRVHAILEDWILKGTSPDLSESYTYKDRRGNDVTRYPGQIAHRGLHLLPAPMDPNWEVEQEVQIKTSAGPWIMRVDLRHKTDGIVVDHKTTGSPRYALTPETLRHDPQAVLYAGAEMHRVGVNAVDLEWNYFPTHGTKKPWKVNLRVHKDEITPDLDQLDKDADLIWRTYRTPGITAGQVPANPAACGAYGGCEYADICERNPLDLFDQKDNTTVNNPEAKQAMSELEALLQAGGINPPPAPDQVPPPPPPPAPAAEQAPPPPPPAPPAPAAVDSSSTDVVVTPALNAERAPADLSAMSRADLKARAVALGVLDPGSRLRKPAIVELLSGAPRAPVKDPHFNGCPVGGPAPAPTLATVKALPPPPPRPTNVNAPSEHMQKQAQDLWVAVFLQHNSRGEIAISQANDAVDAFYAKFGV